MSSNHPELSKTKLKDSVYFKLKSYYRNLEKKNLHNSSAILLLLFLRAFPSENPVGKIILMGRCVCFSSVLPFETCHSCKSSLAYCIIFFMILYE
jgi:hypothetical protein